MLMASRLAMLGVCAVMCGMTAGCGPSASENPLIGKWRLIPEESPGGTAGCYSAIEFTQDQQILTLNGSTGPSTKVAYNVSPKKVYVTGNTGTGALGYDILAPDKIQLESRTPCTYARE